MDIADLKALVAVAETGSFSEAAERLFITQPAVSKRIAALEAELGTPLFDRIGRHIELTETGAALLPRSRDILAQVGDLRRQAGNLAVTVSGKLNMATSHHIGLHRLPPALRQYTQDFPQVDLNLEFLASEVACEAVLAGRLELAVVTLPAKPIARLAMAPVWPDPLALVVGQGHPLTGVANPGVAELVQFPAILPGPDTVTRSEVVRALGSQAKKLTVRMTSNYLEVLKTLTSIGLGWSALPETMIDDSLRVVHVNKITIKRRLGIVTHADRTLSNAARSMIETIRNAT
ncbi:MAG: LysR family transcriptional regulator [Gammaproteobacteria bacterium]|nr:LysR family transcriptional regulator [Gammaproteobacteria bacterium]